MSPQSRRPAKSRSPKTPRRDTETTETQPAAVGSAAPATEAEATAIKPTSAFPLQVPLETGLSDYGMWCEMFAHAKHQPLPPGERRGRIWG